MIKGFVLLVTIYYGNMPEVKRPVFYETQAECERVYAEVQYTYTNKRTKVDGGCFNTEDPAVKRYLAEELSIRSNTN